MRLKYQILRREYYHGKEPFSRVGTGLANPYQSGDDDEECECESGSIEKQTDL
jgi:hypothetical protein